MKKLNFTMLKQMSWKKSNTAYCQLSMRRRCLVIAFSMLVILLLWYLLVDLPLSSRLSALDEQAMRLQHMILDNNKKASDVVKASGVADPEAQQQNQQLENRIAKLNEGLALVNSGDIFPKQASVIMQALLNDESGLTLIALNSLPTKVLKDFDDKGRVLYIHDITLTFKGNYFATLSYLKSLENIKWRLFWDDFSYQVKQYPEAEIKLHVYALSTSGAKVTKDDQQQKNY